MRAVVFLILLPVYALAISREDLVAYGVSVLPERQKNAILEYFDTIGFEVSSAGNAQIKLKNEKLVDNECFSTLAANFYSTLATEAVSNEKSLGSLFGDDNLSKTIRDRGFPSGYVWDTALKVAGGDSNLAMQIIGLCGHDDTNTVLSLPAPDQKTWCFL